MTLKTKTQNKGGDMVDSKKQWKTLYREQINMGVCYCYLCGKIIKKQDDFSLDHETPLSRHGENNPSNWKPAHKSCNHDKGALTYEEYLLYRTLVRKKNGEKIK